MLSEEQIAHGRDAFDHITHNMVQLDQDGINVSVSREAPEAVLSIVAPALYPEACPSQDHAPTALGERAQNLDELGIQCDEAVRVLLGACDGDEFRHAVDTLYGAFLIAAKCIKDHPRPSPDTANPTSDDAGHSWTTYTLSWISAPRPPVHPDEMRGIQSCATFDEALKRFQGLADDARFVSLTEYDHRERDASARFRAALKAGGDHG